MNQFRLLSLTADPAMEDYDARLEYAFYEYDSESENEKNEYNKHNEETFVDDEDYLDVDELYEFNHKYGVTFTREQLNIFNEYKERHGLEIEDTFSYIQSCHNCGKQLTVFGNEYCSRRCCSYREDYDYSCVRGENCLICYGCPDQVVNACYWGPDCSQCASYCGAEEDRFSLSCSICLKPMTDHEGYGVDHRNDGNDELYCNICAENILDKKGFYDNDDDDDSDHDDSDDSDAKKRPYDSEDDYEPNKRHRAEDASSDSSVDSRKRKRDHDESVEGSDQENLQDKKPRSYAKANLMDDLVLDSDSDIESIARYSDHCDDMDYEEDARVVQCLEAVAESDADIIRRLRAENAVLRDLLLDNTLELHIPEGCQPCFHYVAGEIRRVGIVEQTHHSASTPLTLDDLNCDDMEEDSDCDLMDYDNDSN
jgi:hypothetical protein